MVRYAKPSAFLKVLLLAFVAYSVNGSARASGPLEEIHGSGVVKISHHATGHYDKVVIDLPYVVQLQLADSETVTLTADDNVMPLLTVVVENQVLHLSMTGPDSCIKPTVLRVQLHAKNLSDIRLQGGAVIQIKGLTIGDAKKAHGTCGN